MKVDIKTSIDISKKEEDYLRTIFTDDTFEIQKSVFTPGLDSTYLILNFVISSVLGGLLYDLLKKGVNKIFRKNSTPTDREFAITIKYNDLFYKLKGDEVSKLGKNGIYMQLKSIDDMFKELEETSIRTSRKDDNK